jgi:hypothetical protein
MTLRVARLSCLVVSLCLVLLLCCWPLAHAQSTSLSYSGGATALNPFRGFAAYLDSTGETAQQPGFPTSLEFTYVSVADVLQSESGTLDWSVVDGALTRAAARGHHAILRLYVDYPATPPSGVPTFLNQGANPVTYKAYTDYGGGSSPDYSNTRLIDQMVYVIAAFGARYDQDARLAYVQLGLLGFWGEWHCYPHDPAVWFATRAVQTRIFAAYESAFTYTKRLVSQDEFQYWTTTDTAYPPTSQYSLGWHDDAFGDSTYSSTGTQEDFYFYSHLQAHNLLDRYQTQVMAGEILPDLQASIFAGDGSYKGQAFAPAAAATHVSWLLFNQAFVSTNSATYTKNAAEASLLLGYQFYVQAMTFTEPAACVNDAATMCSVAKVTIVNKGNAPFPYDLTAVFTDFTAPLSTISVDGSFNTFGASSSAIVTAQLHWIPSSNPNGLFTFAMVSHRASDSVTGGKVVWANAGLDDKGALKVSAVSGTTSTTGSDDSSSSSSSTGGAANSATAQSAGSSSVACFLALGAAWWTSQ